MEGTTCPAVWRQEYQRCVQTCAGENTLYRMTTLSLCSLAQHSLPPPWPVLQQG